MQLPKLRDLYNACLQNPNYHFRDLSQEDFLASAKKSFNRLQEKQRKVVIDSWTAAKAEANEPVTADNMKESAEEMVRMRFLAQTNLFFLGNLLEKYSQMTLSTHEEICNDFFTQKDPTFVTFEQFANQYTGLKDKMLLVPRGGFKSSIDIADTVQWIICFPENTILILTGVYKLAGDFLHEIRQHFTLEQTNETNKAGKPVYAPRLLRDKITNEWSKSLFQVLFPEHCIPPGEGNQFEFQTPAAGEDKEPTVRAASIEQALSGMHIGVLKLDDVHTNENTKTVDRMKGTKKQISIDKAMMHPYGFFDVIGTWYDEQDFYGETIKREEKLAEKKGLQSNIIGSVDSGRFNSSVNFKVYLRACWWPTAAAEKAGKIEEEMKKDDWVLWFPERLPYEYLRTQQENDTEQDEDGDTGYFAIKYLNNPRKVNKVKFPRELLMRRTIPHSQMPPQGQGIVVTTVDAAYSTKSWADYTVIMTALIFGGRFYIINMVRGKFNENELPAVIAGVAHKWKPRRIAIEDSVGVKWLRREIEREQDKLQIRVPVEFVSLGLGSKSNSKKMKAKPVVRLLGDDRMFFINSCEGLQELHAEMEKFTGTKDDAHDDVVSAISLLAEVFGAYADMDKRMNSVNSSYVSDTQAKAKHDMIYGLGRYAKYNAANMADDNPVTVFQMETSGQFQGGSDIDPLASLF